jgi:uncharacterized membrane protein
MCSRDDKELHMAGIVSGAADKAKQTGEDAADQAKDTAEGAADTAKDAAGGATSSLREQVVGSFTNAARDILGPPLQQMSQQAAEQAANYAKEQAPKLLKEVVLPQAMKTVGADKPGDIAKMGVGKVGEAISGAGGITGLAGKLMSKIGGGGKGGGNATGYGVKRRMPVQQDLMVSVNVEDAFKGWTEYKRWTEYMFRANTVDFQVQDEEDGEARVKVLEKMWMFKRPFTAQIDSQVPNEHIRWRATEGTKHVGTIAFHELAKNLTLISVNVDHGPAGPIEKIARGARFDKRAIRADLHRFKGWIEMKTPEDIDDMDGWLGTIQGGKIVQTHEDYLAEHEEEQDERDQDEEPQDEAEEQEPADDEEEDDSQADEEWDEEEEEEDEEDYEDEEEAEEEGDTEADTESDEDVNADEEEPGPKLKQLARKRAAKKPSARRRRSRS